MKKAIVSMVAAVVAILSMVAAMVASIALGDGRLFLVGGIGIALMIPVLDLAEAQLFKAKAKKVKAEIGFGLSVDTDALRQAYTDQVFADLAAVVAKADAYYEESQKRLLKAKSSFEIMTAVETPWDDNDAIEAIPSVTGMRTKVRRSGRLSGGEFVVVHNVRRNTVANLSKKDASKNKR